MYDVAIIGAGPSGSCAAVMLARARCRVLIVEQHRFPRAKVCGECLSSLGIAVLSRLGLASAIETARPVVLNKTAMYSADGSSAVLSLGQPMWGISRHRLDAALLQSAIDAGAELLQPARVESLTSHVEVAEVGIRNLVENRHFKLNVRFALIADGKGALLSKRPRPTLDLGLKTHFTHVNGPGDSIELFGFRGHYGGLAPIEDGRWNAAFSVPSKVIAEFKGDLDGLLAQMLQENATLRVRLSSARRCGRWLTSPLPRHGVAADWPPCVIPIGNAAAAIEPIGGEGMGLALRSAELAAQTLIAHINDCKPYVPARLRAAFAALWRKRRAGCRGFAMAFSRPILADMIVASAPAADGLSSRVMKMMGK